MNTDRLTAEQRVLFDRVFREAMRDGRPVADLLLRADVPAGDRAAVADVFTPGAGQGYL